MYALIERETKSGQKKYEKVSGILMATFFDDVNAKIQVTEDCCVRVPVKPKYINKFKEV